MYPVVISAEPDELKFFLGDFKLEKEVVKGFTRMFFGEFRGKKLGLACLGVGKVNAAAGTALVNCKMQPDILFMVGASGAISPEVVPGDIVVGSGIIDRDVGFLTGHGLIPGGSWLYERLKPYDPYLVREITTDPNLLELAEAVAKEAEPQLESFGERKAKIHFGAISTGEQFIASLSEKERLYENYQVLAAEMEGSGFAQTAYALDLPFLVIRGISDHADDSLDIKAPVVYPDTKALTALLSGKKSPNPNSDPLLRACDAAKTLHSVFQKAAYNASLMAFSIIQRLP